MKNISVYLTESKEDGNYLELPQKMYKPHFWPGQSKESKDSAKAAWKAYQQSIIKINEENFEILIDKLKNAMQSKKGHNNFILNAQTCKFDSFYGRKEGDIFDTVETATKEARLALESTDIKVNFKRTRQREKRNSYDRDDYVWWNSQDSYTASIYWALSVIAQAYNIDIPKFNEDFLTYVIATVDSRLDDWTRNGSHSQRISDEKYSKMRQKFSEEYEKDATKLKKVREKFKETELYKDIIGILDIVEDDLKAADENYKSFKQDYEEALKKDEDAKKLAEAIKIVKPYVDDVLSSEFSSPNSVSWGKERLYNAAGQAYLESDNKEPDIKIQSTKIGSWLSGMHKTVEFEVIGANGKSYGIIKLEDKGLNDDDGRPVDGFGPWD